MTAHATAANPFRQRPSTRATSLVRGPGLGHHVRVAAQRLSALLLLVATAATGGCTRSHHADAGPPAPVPRIELVKAHESLSCPARAQENEEGTPQVPLSPAAGAERLAPLQTPTRLIVCRYRGGRTFRLAGAREVRSGLASARLELAWMPRANVTGDTCTAIGGRYTPYLVGLRYPDGVLWLSTAYDVNGCVRTSNGTFTAEGYIGADTDRAYDTGTWVADVPDPVDAGNHSSCGDAPRGRLGQDRQLVPPGAVRLTLCAADGAHSPAAVPIHVRRDFTALVRALDGVMTSPTGNSCDPDGEDVVDYEARFDYAEGPAVLVSIRKNCFPLLSNGSLDGVGSSQIWAMTDDLARHPG